MLDVAPSRDPLAPGHAVEIVLATGHLTLLPCAASTAATWLSALLREAMAAKLQAAAGVVHRLVCKAAMPPLIMMVLRGFLVVMAVPVAVVVVGPVASLVAAEVAAAVVAGQQLEAMLL